MQQTLDGCEDGGDIVRRRPTVLEDVETQLSVSVDVGVEHARQKFDGGGFIGVCFVKSKEKLERAIFERRFGCKVAQWSCGLFADLERRTYQVQK